MRRAKGYTLIELMVGTCVGLLVIGSALAFFTVNTAMGTEQMQRDFLRTQLNQIGTMMGNEIARAGFCYDCQNINTFIISDAAGARSSVLIDDSATSETGSCVRFSYFYDDGDASTVKEQIKGYRLQNNDKDSVIEIYQRRNGTSNWSCSDGTYWQDIKFKNVTINTLTFTRKHYEVMDSNNRLQNISINIEASLMDDAIPSVDWITEKFALTITLPNVDA